MKTTKRFISIMLVVLMAFSSFPLTAIASTEKSDANGENDNAVWHYTASDDTLYINTKKNTGLKSYDDPLTSKTEHYLPTVYQDEQGETKLWRGTFSRLVVGKRVTSLGSPLGYDKDAKFYPYPDLTKVEFEPESSLILINPYIFYKSAITKFDFPQSVVEIDEYAFSGSMLESITIPSAITKIKKNAFSDCKSLTTVQLQASITSTGDSIFKGCSKLSTVNLPEGLANIGAYGFSGCSSLSSISLPDSVETIGNYAFSGSGLSSVSMSENLVTVGNYAFESTDITSVSLPSTVTSIGTYAFAECSLLESAELGGVEMKTISKSAFLNCSSLASLNAPYVEIVDTEALSGTSALVNLTMPVLRAVYEKGFCSSGIESIEFVSGKDTPSYIGNGAFMSCTNLSDVKLPSDLNIISSKAFQSCSRLKKIVVPEYTSSVCANAFSATPITSITVLNKKCSINENALNKTEDAYDDDLVVRGYTGSTAEEFAIANGITFFAIDDFEIEDESYIPTEAEIAANKLKGSWANGTWKINKNELYIYGEGEMTDNIAIDYNGDAKTFGNLINENSLSKVRIENGVTSIADYFLAADERCCLTTVFVSTTCEKIGKYAFADSNVIYVFPNNSTFTGLAGNSSFNYIIFPYSVKEIGEYAFANCTFATATTILPFDITEVSEGLFYNTNISSVEMYGYVTKIGKKAFANCNSLNNIAVPCSADIYIDDENPADNSFGTNDNGLITNVTVSCRESSAAYRYAQSYGIKTTISNGPAYAYGTITSTSKSGLVTSNYSLNWSYYPEDKALRITEGSASGSNIFNKYILDKMVAADADTQVTIMENATVYNLIEYGSISGLIGPSKPSTKDYDYGSMPVDEIIVEEGITELSCSDLFGAFNPKKITLPESLTTLNYHTFRGCDRLERIYIPMSVTSIEEDAFADCYNLIGVNLGGITNIDDSMFANRKKLKIVNMNNVQTIGDNAFSRCVELQEIVIPDTTVSIGTRAFYKCIKAQQIILGKNVTSIAKNAFDDLAYCEKITVKANLPAQATLGGFNDIGATTAGVDLVFSDDVTSADFSAFCNAKIININLGAGMNSISNTKYLPYAKTITVSESNKNYFVDSNCLYNSTEALVYVPAQCDTVTLRETTSAVSDYALCNSSIVGITIPSSVTSIGNYALANAKALKNIEIKKGTASIGNGAFEGCTSLRSFYAPSSLTTIGDSAFKNCTRMASVILPTKLGHIGAEAFMGCSSLVGMVVNENVTSIGDRAYMDCTNLEEIYIWYDAELGSNVFDNDNNLTIFTMVGSDAYRYAREFGIPYSAYTDEDSFYDICGEKIDVYAGYLGFCTDGHGDIEWLTVYDADCENDGYVIGVCEYCSEILEEKHIDAMGHDYKLTARIAATDTVRGMMVYSCQRCGESFCEYVEPTGDEAQIETHKITGNVTIATSKTAVIGKSPARNVSVVINDMVVAKTNENGQFELMLESGTYEAQLVYAYGFTRTIYFVVEDEDLICESIPIIGCDFNKDGVIDDDDLSLFKMVISATANDLSYLDYVDMDNNGYINAKDMAYINACRGINAADYAYDEIVIQK